MTEFFAHPTATVDDGATIGEGTKVWHYSHVMPGAVIGRDCSLGQNVYRRQRSRRSATTSRSRTTCPSTTA